MKINRFSKVVAVHNFPQVFQKCPVTYGNSITWVIAAFGNSFMAALAAFSKISRN